MLSLKSPNSKIMWSIKLILIIVTLLSIANFTFEYGVKITSEQKTIDFPSFYWASDALFNHHVSPYDFNYLQSNTEKKIFPFLYPPPSVILFYPLSLFEYKNALVIYSIINHLAIIAAIFLLIKIFNYKYLSIQSLLLTIIIYNSYPLIENIYSGQVSVIVLVFLLIFILLKDTFQTIACLALALAIILKMYPVVILPVLLINKKYKLLITTTSLLILLTLGSTLFIPSFVWNDWLVNVVPSGGYGEYPEGLTDVSLFDNKGVNGVFAEILIKQDPSKVMNYPVFAKAATYGICIALVIITFLVVYRYIDQNDRKALEKIVFVTLPLIFLIAPFSWTHHIITIYPTIIYLLMIYFQASLKKPKLQMLFIILIILIIFKTSTVIEIFAAISMLWLLMLETIIKQKSLLPSPQIALQPSELHD
ncbi:glycosyltransferase family 87 protein [Herpetosiphon gulosus]|uniref:DUF2029 domain-containing protein n=1 Tax=Herpetosiphon gulosus TaxID=1973496 RepID=A0ABP9WWV9_9CHLR